MAVIEGRTWPDLLAVEECWRLVEAEEIGRVAVLVDGIPEIYPVNHAVDDHSIIFRTDPGSKLRGIVRSPMVCFEVDAIDPATQRGWSVMVKGRATELAAPTEIARAKALPLRYWARGEKSHWISIEPLEVSGRRIHRPEADR